MKNGFRQTQIFSDWNQKSPANPCWKRAEETDCIFSSRVQTDWHFFLLNDLRNRLQEGVYVQFTGPNYETPAEVRLAQWWGGDAVGMSTACEAMAARHMGLEICGISCITNMAAGISKEELNHKEVQETADRVAKSFKELVTEIIVNM